MNFVTEYLKPIIAFALVAGFAGLYFSSGSKADDLTNEFREYGFKFSGLAAIGFFLMLSIPYNFGDRLNGKTRTKIIELFGRRRTDTFIEIHIAQKLALAAGQVLLFGIILLFGDVTCSFWVFGLATIALIWYWTDKELDKKLRHKKRGILIDLPEFTNTLVLLVNAGLPFTGAVQKIVREADANKPLYKELNFLVYDINAGRPINQAYENLVERCRVPEITRFVSTVLQNLNRGSSDLVHVLRVLALEAWQRRRDIAKKQGEEAASKLVFPMVLVFLAVAIIVLAPAVMTMGR